MIKTIKIICCISENWDLTLPISIVFNGNYISRVGDRQECLSFGDYISSYNWSDVRCISDTWSRDT